jgi:hypothetical protein
MKRRNLAAYFYLNQYEPLRGAKLQMTCSQQQYQELDNLSNHYLIG